MPDGAIPQPDTVWQQDLPWIDPHDAAWAFADLPTLVLLDSTGPTDDPGRYSTLCIDPYRRITAPAAATAGALAALADALHAHRLPPAPAGTPGAMPFRGGAAGLIGYACGAALEQVATAPAGPDDPPDLCIGLYDLVIGFDRREQRCRIHATGLPAALPDRPRRAAARLAWATARLAAASAPPPTPLPALDWTPDWDEPEYREVLAHLLAAIHAGDIYQANLTMRQIAPRPPNLHGWAVHRALRTRNPAPFGAWLRWGGFDLCCSSPERFVRLDPDGAMETRPIKGTIARAAHPTADRHADRAAAAALQASAKDRAENTMIVDVLRHDLGRVARPGSVAVPSLCALESYATVHHLVSRITARLRPELTATDLLRAAIPGGSITGAPKIRAMQLIAQLEAGRRGAYCGSVVALGWDGAMDSNIVIRSLLLTPGRVIAQSGGAIVADSDPASEYAEMMLKSAPMRAVFGPA